MAAERIAEHLAQALLTLAARRWPTGLAELMRAEWSAELATLRGRPRRMLAFAASLAVANPPGVTAASHAAAATAAALVLLVAAALFNGVRSALHSVEAALPWSGETALVLTLLAAALLAMATAGARRAPRRPLRAATLTGLSAWAFLLAGNQTAIMPFMGWRDITPAVATWTILTLLTITAVHHLRRAARPRLAAATAVTGALLTVEAAAITGCLHAATTLGVPLSSAPAWFPLALLPGGTGGFGPLLPAAHPSLGNLQAVDPTFGDLHAAGPALADLPGAAQVFHASDILLAGAATLIGPLLLCTAFLTAALLRTTPRAAPAHYRASLPPLLKALHRRTKTLGRPTGPLSRPAKTLTRPVKTLARRVDPQIAAGTAVAASTLVLAGRLPRSTTVAEHALPRLIDNSTVFGFGFLAHPAGQAALALAAALLTVHHLAQRTSPPAL